MNPDHIYAVEASPDTTLRLVNGETIIVRETLDELIDEGRGVPPADHAVAMTLRPSLP